MAVVPAGLAAVFLTCLLAAPTACGPWDTPAPPPAGPPPGASTCIFTKDSVTHYISPGQTKIIVDSASTVCEAYLCDGNTGTASLEFALSATCSSGCVDVAGSVTYCKCLSNCPGGPPAAPSDVCATTQPCSNGGTCSNTGGDSFSCACPAGYEGDRCQIDKCDSYCLNGGTCVHDSARSTGVRCECATGYLDEQCQTPRCTSAVNPCYNGGVCVMDTSSSVGYACQCVPGYSGPHCETVSTCEASWTKEGVYCYKTFDMKRTYDQAVDRCQQEGAIVSKSQSQAENDYIRGLLVDGMWLGVRDSVQEGSWVWSDGSPAFTASGDFTKWKSGEPDNAHGTETDADCVSANSNGKWMDIPCSNKKVFVCRKDL
ncbi:neurocan core protein-like [Littorina saxatilis]|uniref:C-type lectin n=1 Tax=Littorina saxatilis TaxID=31220 RepID=A0AAN9BSB3_9CAEN